MNQESSFNIFLSCILACSLVLVGCGRTPSAVSRPTSIFSQTPWKATPVAPSATDVIEITPTFTPKAILITPDNLFTFPGLKLVNTPDPDSRDFCEHLPLPQIDMNANEFSLLVGRFSLCVSHSWPWVKTAMDLDTGTFVSLDDKSGDIAMDYTHPDLNGDASYFVHGLNNAHIDDIDSASLTYSDCKNKVMEQKDSGSFSVYEGKTACVMTTEGKMAVIRVELIYPSNTQGVEYSFAILKKE
jgi:hypothetical protein